MKIATEIYPEYTLIEIDLEGGIATPEMLREMNLPAVDNKKGVVLSGKGPIWVYGYLIHEYHATAWAATHDPRLGYVVCSTHSPQRKIGEVIDPNEPMIV